MDKVSFIFHTILDINERTFSMIEPVRINRALIKEFITHLGVSTHFESEKRANFHSHPMMRPAVTRTWIEYVKKQRKNREIPPEHVSFFWGQWNCYFRHSIHIFFSRGGSLSAFSDDLFCTMEDEEWILSSIIQEKLTDGETVILPSS